MGVLSHLQVVQLWPRTARWNGIAEVRWRQGKLRTQSGMEFRGVVRYVGLLLLLLLLFFFSFLWKFLWRGEVTMRTRGGAIPREGERAETTRRRAVVGEKGTSRARGKGKGTCRYLR
jgi:hypothetical protein